MSYKSESHLQKAVLNFFKNNTDQFKLNRFGEEFYYNSGKADIVAVNPENQVFVFELKLFNWKKALNQAYRGTSFAHYSYVILPESQVKNALRYKNEFEIRNVGLCSFNRAKLKIEIKAKKTSPLHQWLMTKAQNYAEI